MTRSSITLGNAGRGGLFRRTFEAMMGARERQARQAVVPYLLALDDQTLNAIGHRRSTVEGWGTSGTN